MIRKIGQIFIRGGVLTGKKRKRGKTYEKDVEMALVCHCGASTAGEYINTLSVMELSS